MNSINPESGALNLLVDCLGVKSGDIVVLVREQDNKLYQPVVADTMLNAAKQLGAKVTLYNEALISDSSDFPQSVADAMLRADHTIFLSRLGDYVRFLKLPGKGTKTTCYIYNEKQLASPYATLPNSLLISLRDQLEAELMAAGEWHITCPLGTDISGNFDWSSLTGGEDDELLVSLFPVSTFKPVPCSSANGVVALSRWLMPGGATKMDAQDLAFSGTVFCDVCDGMIKNFHGAEPAHQLVSDHYDHVARALKINRNRVHSWHLGINPQTSFPIPAESDMDTWSALSFASPRYLHFHTCGDEPPGEVAWSLFDCSVRIDGKMYWQAGEFVWLQRDIAKQLIEKYAAQHPTKKTLLKTLLQPSLDIGIF